MAHQYKLIHPAKILRDYLNESVRPDGREHEMFRPLGINSNSLENSSSSAIVKLGNTTIVCGVRAELAKPRAHAPREGFLIPNVDVTFLPFTKLSSTTKNDLSDTISSLILNILTETDCINLEDLCICHEKLVWALHCDVICLEQDGCVLDGAVMACLAALKDLHLPKIVYDSSINKVEVSTETSKLKIKYFPIVSTYAFIENILLADPTFEEESLASALINIGISNGKLRFILKSGGKPVSQKQIDFCAAQTMKREAEILNLFENLV